MLDETGRRPQQDQLGYFAHPVAPEPPTADEAGPLCAHRHPTRWHATPTTFGPYVKVPLTGLLVGVPVGNTAADLVLHGYALGPQSAATLLFGGVGVAVLALVVRGLWRPGVCVGSCGRAG